MKTLTWALFVLLLTGCSGEPANEPGSDQASSQPPVHTPASSEQSLEVTATAYNSLASQTNANPNLTAWGDTLRPGMRAIAVSRDLIPMGLNHNTKVRIDGLQGEFLVLDKMNRRWEKKIDIYMGTDVAAARSWGRRRVIIHWTP